MSRLLAGLGAAALVLGAVLILQPFAPPPSAGGPATRAAPTVALASAAPTPLPPIPPGYRIQIPRLEIDLPILEGDVERDTVQLQTPENFAFHLPGTAIPGKGLNSYLYAHARRGMFLALWNARVGDEVWISTPDGRAMRYLVTEVHPQVRPDDVQWATPTPPDRLTLQTSTGPNPGDPRFVVIAQPG
jgi:LPXTG-site transpeptidase (sortase) family protein